MGQQIEQFLRKLEGRVIKGIGGGIIDLGEGEDFLGDFGIDSGGDP